jgi:hypothetical protein
MYEALLILHFLGLAMGIGTSFFMAGMGIRSASLAADDGPTLMANATAVASVLSLVSLLLLWGTGIALVTVYDGLAESGGVFFYVKVGLALLLTIFVGVIHRLNVRMKRGGAESLVRAVERLGQTVLLLGVAVVVFAVLAFG